MFARPLRFAKGANQIRQRNVSHNTWQRHTWKHQMPSQCGKLSNHLLRVTNHLLLRMLCDLVSSDVALLRYMLKNDNCLMGSGYLWKHIFSSSDHPRLQPFSTSHGKTHSARMHFDESLAAELQHRKQPSTLSSQKSTSSKVDKSKKMHKW